MASRGRGQIDELTAASSEHYLDAELYDFEYRRRRADVNHYRRLAAQLAPDGGAVLELGAGTGRILHALARDGHPVVGLELSETMLARATARGARLPRVVRERVRLVQGDLRRFSLGERFPLVICPFNALQHMYSRLDVEDAFAQVKAHMAAGGRFAFDVLFPDLDWLNRDAKKHWARTKFTHPTTGRRFEYSTTQDYDAIAQILHVRLHYRPLDGKGREKIVRLAHRQFFPQEISALLAHAGFRVEERWGGFSTEPFDGDSDSQVFVCRMA